MGGLRRRRRRRRGHRRRPGRVRTSRRCCWSSGGGICGRRRGRAGRRRRWSRATSPTTRRSSSWAACGSAPPRGCGAGVVCEQVDDRGSGDGTALPGPGPCRGSVGDQLRAGFVGSLPGLALGPHGRRADRPKHAPNLRPRGADPERRAGRRDLRARCAGRAASGSRTARAGSTPCTQSDGRHRRCDGIQPDTHAGRIAARRTPTTTTVPFSDDERLRSGAGGADRPQRRPGGGLLGAYLPDQSQYGPTLEARAAGRSGGGAPARSRAASSAACATPTTA